MELHDIETISGSSFLSIHRDYAGFSDPYPIQAVAKSKLMTR